MKVESLDQLLQEQLRDIYDAEKQLVKALPKMAKAADSEELGEAINEHLEVTKGHVQRLEQVFEKLGTKAKGKTCAAMKGLVEEGEEVIAQDATGQMKDLAIIAAAQRVEHYEIAAYGTVRTFAERLGNEEVAELLQETLTEEEETDERLTEISETLLDAVGEMEGAEEEEEGAEIGEQEQEPVQAGKPKTRKSSGA
jgi:ferritin-like metal-binding protein YciE